MLLISDANIFIDMIEGGLIEEMFRLPEEFRAGTTLNHLAHNSLPKPVCAF